jgi:DNA-binding transcriptional ArsR family regulator
MKSSSALLSPILRSDTQGRLLAELLLHPERELSLTELSRRVGVASATIMRDVDRLVTGGVLKDRRLGRIRLLSADTTYPMNRPLTEIVLYGYGPAAVLPEILTPIEGIEKAYIYGSWAERYLGTPGKDPADVDVLIVGDADRSALYDAARRASTVVGREVNIVSIDPQRWAEPNDGFVRTVRGRGLVELAIGDR